MQENSDRPQTASAAEPTSPTADTNVRNVIGPEIGSGDVPVGATPREQAGQADMQRRPPRTFVIACALLVVVVIGGGLWLRALRDETKQAAQTSAIGPTATTEQATVSPAVATPTGIRVASSTPAFLTLGGSPVPTLPPPLSNVSFPTQAISYPTDWPDELRFPQQFILLTADSGILPDGKSRAWTAKLRMQGDPQEAKEALAAFLRERGWQIQQQELDGGTTILGLERNGEQSTGSVIVDTDPADPSSIRILVTIRL